MNKMFKKLMAVSATVAIAATMSVSAFAEETTPDMTLTPTDGAVIITEEANKPVFDKLPKQETGAQYTVMLFEESFLTDETPNPAKIYYINQGADVNNLVSNMLVKATDDTTFMPEGNYIVRIGNDANLAVVDLTLKVAKKNEGVQITLSYGDVNGDGKIDTTDAGLVLEKYVQPSKVFTDLQSRAIPDTIADVNGDGKVDTTDAGLVLEKYVQPSKIFVDADSNQLITYTYTYTAPTNN